MPQWQAPHAAAAASTPALPVVGALSSKSATSLYTVYGFLSEARLPAVGFLYHSMALTGDVMVRFNEWDAQHHRLFHIRTVVAPAVPTPPLPPFLVPREPIGSFQILDALPSGYFDVVDALASVHTTRDNFYDVNDRWLQSPWVAARQHLVLDFASTPNSEWMRSLLTNRCLGRPSCLPLERRPTSGRRMVPTRLN
jgi:hypothetical protein